MQATVAGAMPRYRAPAANPAFSTAVAHTPISSWCFPVPRYLERDVPIHSPRSFYIGVSDKFNGDKGASAKWDDGSHPRDPHLHTSTYVTYFRFEKKGGFAPFDDSVDQSFTRWVIL
jgi:hypothetical protein